jgi:hypothetical protein
MIGFGRHLEGALIDEMGWAGDGGKEQQIAAGWREDERMPGRGLMKFLKLPDGRGRCNEGRFKKVEERELQVSRNQWMTTSWLPKAARSLRLTSGEAAGTADWGGCLVA